MHRASDVNLSNFVPIIPDLLLIGNILKNADNFTFSEINSDRF